MSHDHVNRSESDDVWSLYLGTRTTEDVYIDLCNPWNAKIFLYKQKDTRFFDLKSS